MLTLKNTIETDVLVVGGGIGGLIAMVFKRHKNKHIDFILTFTVTAILHMVVAFLLIGKFAFVTK